MMDEELARLRDQLNATRRKLRTATMQYETILGWVEFAGVAQDYIEALERDNADLRTRLRRYEEPDL